MCLMKHADLALRLSTGTYQTGAHHQQIPEIPDPCLGDEATIFYPCRVRTEGIVLPVIDEYRTLTVKLCNWRRCARKNIASYNMTQPICRYSDI